MTNRLSNADLDALDTLIAAATPAPWNYAPGPHPDSELTKAEYLASLLRDDDAKVWTTFCLDPESDDPEDYIVPAVTGDGPTSEANASLVANARNMPPMLLAEVRDVRHMRVLERLAAAGRDGITGTDAITALDTFIERAARHILAEVDAKTETFEGRERMLTQIFGSDAVRVAAVLMNGAPR